MRITVENICQICEKEGCQEPCDKYYYDLIEGKEIPPSDFGIVDEKEKNDDKI